MGTRRSRRTARTLFSISRPYSAAVAPPRFAAHRRTRRNTRAQRDGRDGDERADVTTGSARPRSKQHARRERRDSGRVRSSVHPVRLRRRPRCALIDERAATEGGDEHAGAKRRYPFAARGERRDQGRARSSMPAARRGRARRAALVERVSLLVFSVNLSKEVIIDMTTGVSPRSFPVRSRPAFTNEVVQN